MKVLPVPVASVSRMRDFSVAMASLLVQWLSLIVASLEVTALVLEGYCMRSGLAMGLASAKVRLQSSSGAGYGPRAFLALLHIDGVKFAAVCGIA